MTSVTYSYIDDGIVDNPFNGKTTTISLFKGELSIEHSKDFEHMLRIGDAYNLPLVIVK